MKKIKITENQFNLIKLLKENIDFVERAKNKFTELKKDANILYNMITFSILYDTIIVCKFIQLYINSDV